MFKSETLFVVGAGASCEADLPSGEALKHKIATILNIQINRYHGMDSGDDRVWHYLKQATLSDASLKGDPNVLLRKAWRIRDIMPTTAISIDNFLDAHRDDKHLVLCGKLSIVKAILDAEATSKLKTTGNYLRKFDIKEVAGTWYVEFLKLLTENVAKSELASILSNVSFITFNYDRCIERFLAQGLADYYDLNDHETNQLMKNLKIVHP